MWILVDGRWRLVSLWVADEDVRAMKRYYRKAGHPILAIMRRKPAYLTPSPDYDMEG